jgi:glucose-1-phosphate cytidylyltransferase
MGMRLRDYSESVPKPMVPIGNRPILWHVMKYYAHCGHHDFILCLGYKADVIKNYFLNYNECLSNDFVLSQGGKNIELLKADIDDWHIRFVDTGLTSSIGQRLKAVEKHLQGEEMFLANYSDGLSDVDLPKVIETFRRSGKLACLVSVKPRASFHLIETGPDGIVHKTEHIADAGLYVNGGFFVFRHEIFEYLRTGEDLVAEPMNRLIADRELIAYRYDGFWACMDTFKEKQTLEDIYAQGRAPWAIWNGQHARSNSKLTTHIKAA